MNKTTQKVLTFLQDKGDWVYGLDIVREVGLPSGTLNVHTARLERGGYVTSKWGEPVSSNPGAPRRRYYKATGKAVPVEVSSSRPSPAHPRFA